MFHYICMSIYVLLNTSKRVCAYNKHDSDKKFFQISWNLIWFKGPAVCQFCKIKVCNCKSLYICVFFVLRFYDHRLIHWYKNLWCMTFSKCNFYICKCSQGIKLVNIRGNKILTNNCELTVVTDSPGCDINGILLL